MYILSSWQQQLQVNNEGNGAFLQMQQGTPVLPIGSSAR